MCEVRRVFHNVNSDSKKVIPFSKTKKPVVNCYEHTDSETNIKNLQKEEIAVFPKENGSTKTLENSKGKKNQMDLENQFSEPKLLTSLKVLESLKNIGNEKKPKKSARINFQPESSTQKQKAYVFQASRKVNIPFEEQVYKGLIELQVTDEDLGLRNIPLRPKEFVKIKEPEPVLSDYYKPKFNKEYIVKPAVPKFEVNSVFVTEIPSILATAKHWEPEKSS